MGKSSLRWLILLFGCWINVGNFYAFDNPAALHQQLKHWLPSDSETFKIRFTLFYSCYAIPNIIIPLLIGGLLDLHGVNSILLILAGFVCIGQGLFALGCQMKIYWIMLLGRIIFGFGGESLAVAQARLVTTWFSGNELALAIGITLSISRFGTVFNNFLSPIFCKTFSLPTSLWLSFSFCLGSFVFTFVTVLVNSKNKFSPSKLGVFELFRSTPTIIKTFHPAFLILCFLSYLYNGSSVPFNNNASDFLKRKWYKGDDLKTATIQSIPDVMSIFLIPFLGYIIDNFGFKIPVLVMGGLFYGIGHFFLSGSIQSPVLPLVSIGFATTTLLAIWPCVPPLVPEMYLATAYGLITVCINCSYVFVPMIVAILNIQDDTYTSAEMFFCLQGFFGVFLSIILTRINLRYTLNLNASEVEAITTPPWLPEINIDDLPPGPTFSGPIESLVVLPDQDFFDTVEEEEEEESFSQLKRPVKRKIRGFLDDHYFVDSKTSSALYPGLDRRGKRRMTLPNQFFPSPSFNSII